MASSSAYRDTSIKVVFVGDEAGAAPKIFKNKIDYKQSVQTIKNILEGQCKLSPTTPYYRAGRVHFKVGGKLEDLSEATLQLVRDSSAAEVKITMYVTADAPATTPSRARTPGRHATSPRPSSTQKRTPRKVQAVTPGKQLKSDGPEKQTGVKADGKAAELVAQRMEMGMGMGMEVVSTAEAHECVADQQLGISQEHDKALVNRVETVLDVAAELEEEASAHIDEQREILAALAVALAATTSAPTPVPGPVPSDGACTSPAAAAAITPMPSPTARSPLRTRALPKPAPASALAPAPAPPAAPTPMPLPSPASPKAEPEQYAPEYHADSDLAPDWLEAAEAVVPAGSRRRSSLSRQSVGGAARLVEAIRAPGRRASIVMIRQHQEAQKRDYERMAQELIDSTWADVGGTNTPSPVRRRSYGSSRSCSPVPGSGRSPYSALSFQGSPMRHGIKAQEQMGAWTEAPEQEQEQDVSALDFNQVGEAQGVEADAEGEEAEEVEGEEGEGQEEEEGEQAQETGVQEEGQVAANQQSAEPAIGTEAESVGAGAAVSAEKPAAQDAAPAPASASKPPAPSPTVRSARNVRKPFVAGSLQAQAQGQSVYPAGRTAGETLANNDLHMRDIPAGSVKKVRRKGLMSPQPSSNGQGPPSPGTIMKQWLFMKNAGYGNNDSELEWKMASSDKGAYRYAHGKYEAAEDRYFHLLDIIERYTVSLDQLSQGTASRVPAVVSALANLSDLFRRNPHSKETGAHVLRVQRQLCELHKSPPEVEEVGGAPLWQGSIFAAFSRKTEDALGVLLVEKDKGKLVRTARNLVERLKTEGAGLKGRLSAAHTESEAVLKDMETWSQREIGCMDYASTMLEQDAAWGEEHRALNAEAYTLMRGLVPADVAELSVAEIMLRAEMQGGLMPLELAQEVKANKLLHWLVTHTSDIAMASFLTGELKFHFENIDSLDVLELRALALHMPARFENDKDGAKASWRAGFMARVKQLVGQQQGELVKGVWDAAQNKRTRVPQQTLKPSQQRRSLYFYRTVEEYGKRLAQYDTKAALLQRKEEALVAASEALGMSKLEYETTLIELRDPADLAQWGLATLTKSKNTAKTQCTEAERKHKQLQSDVHNLQRTIASNPVSRGQFEDAEVQTRAFLLERGGEGDRQEVVGVFDELQEVVRVERHAARFVSAEEAAAATRAEVEAISGRALYSAEDTLHSAMDAQTPEALSVPSVPSDAPGEADSEPAQAQAQVGRLRASVRDVFTRRASEALPRSPLERNRRMTVQNRVGPEMMSIFTRMHSTHSKEAELDSRTVRTGTWARPLDGGKDDGREGCLGPELLQPKEARKAHSSTLQKLLDRQALSTRPPGALSPKRGGGGGGGPLSFLAQIQARAGGLEGPRSLFSDIAKLRRPEQEDVDKENGGDKENGQGDNINSDSASAKGAKGVKEAVLGVPQSREAAPLSMLDQIKQRRLD